MQEKTKILIIEDEPEIRRFLRVSLNQQGYETIEATDGSEGIEHAVNFRPDAITLDLGLPDMDGVDIVKSIREWSSVPIIVLSARQQQDDKVVALDYGADDYVTKPFGVKELMARIRVVLRQSNKDEKQDSVFKTGELEVDIAARKVSVAGKTIKLTPTEYKLLLALVKCAGKVVMHDVLLKEGWGQGYAKQMHYLRVYMNNLRKKIEEQPARPMYIMTEPHVGYRLNTDHS